MASKSTYKRPSQKKPSKPAQQLYGWYGGPRTHTIPQAQHEANVQTTRAGLDPNVPLDAQMTPAEAVRYANAQADAQFGPQIQANQMLYQSTPGWFESYRNESVGRQNAAQQYANTVLAPLQQAAQAAPQLPPGLDPNSPEAARALEAAKAGQAMNQASYGSAAAVPIALNSYLTGAQDVAQRELPQAMSAIAQQGAALKSQRGEYATQQLGDLRTNAQNYSIASQTLGLNKAKSQADIDLQRGIDPVTGKRLPSDPEKPITSGPFAGLTGSKVNAMTSEQRQTAIDNYNKAVHPPKTPKDPNALTPSEQRAEARRKERQKADEAKRVAGVRAGSGKVLARVQDAQDAWEQFRQRRVKTNRVDANGKPVLVKGSPETRAATTQDVREWMTGAGYEPGLVHVMLLRRVNKPLDQAAIDYLHSKGVRIPRSWLPGGGIVPGGKGDPKPAGTAGGIGGK